MKNSLILLILLFTGCASFQVSTLNHDPIYSIEGSDAEITVVNNEFELQRLLRNDFHFRYNFAQYAKSQPRSFDWNNRILRNSRFDIFNRFNRFNRYNWNNGWGYSSYWNRDQMWDDWLWGFSYGGGIGWSYSWNNNSWSSNYWNSPYGWNNYYGWNNGYPRSNVAHHSGRRGTSNISSRIAVNRNKPRGSNQVNLDELAIKIKKRGFKNVVISNSPNIVIQNNTNNNSKPIRIYKQPNNNSNNNTPPRIYTRPSSNTNKSTTRPSSNVSRNTSTSRGGNSNRKN